MYFKWLAQADLKILHKIITMNKITLSLLNLLFVLFLFSNGSYAQQLSEYGDKYHSFYNSDGLLSKKIHHESFNDQYDSTLYFYNKQKKLAKTIEYSKGDTTLTLYTYENGLLKNKTTHNTNYFYQYNKNGKLKYKIRIKEGKTDTTEFYKYSDGKLTFKRLHLYFGQSIMYDLNRYHYKNGLLIKEESIDLKGNVTATKILSYNKNGNLKSESFDGSSLYDSIKYKYDKNDSLIQTKYYDEGELYSLEEWNYMKNKILYKKYLIPNNNRELEKEKIKKYNDNGIIREEIYLIKPQTVLIEVIE